jgi:hypothetical protein
LRLCRLKVRASPFLTARCGLVEMKESWRLASSALTYRISTFKRLRSIVVPSLRESCDRARLYSVSA